MKRIFAIAFLLTSAAFANDSGAYMIDVKGIDPSNGQTGSNYVSAKDGSGFRFRGPGAVNLAKRLPPIYSVEPENDKYSRSLHIVSGGWELILSCSTAEWTEDGIKPWENYATCEINLWSLAEIGAPEGDTSPFKELDYKVAEVDRSVEKIHVDLIDNTRAPQERFDNPPVAKSGTKITFYGKDTEQFLRLLADSKKLTIAGKGKPADGMDNKLVISCEKAKDPADSKCSIEYTEQPR